MPSDTSIDTGAIATPAPPHDRHAPALPAGAGLVIGIAAGTLMWAGLLAMFLG